MIKISPKTNNYLAPAKQAMNLLKYKKLIRVLPTAFLFVLGIVICIVASSAVPLIINAIAVIYFFVITSVLSNLYNKYNAEVKRICIEHYKFAPYVKEAVPTAIKNDNKMITAKVNVTGAVNSLLCWEQNEELHFISNSLITIDRSEFKTATVEKYQDALKRDFGDLVISINTVDHYRDDVLVCKFKDSVLKVEFNNHVAFDKFIPTRDFYFNSKKKSDSFGNYKS